MFVRGGLGDGAAVQALVERLRRRFGAQVEERTLVEEDVSFAPPRSLRSLTVVR